MTPDQTVVVPAPAPARPVVDDDEQWEKEACEARHTALTKVQATADAWSKSIGAVLGAFALVAFIKGPEALKDLPTGAPARVTMPVINWTVDAGPAVVDLIFLAAIATSIAVVTAAVAAQGVPGWDRILDGPTYMERVTSSTRRAIDLLRWSRLTTLLAAVLLFAGLAIAWQATLQKLAAATPPTQAAIVSAPGAPPQCGVVAGADDGSLTFAVAKASPVPLPALASVTLVDECP